jgi:hypothetical protein
MSVDQHETDESVTAEQVRLIKIARDVARAETVDFHHERCVQLICAMLARRIDTGPADASPVSRRQRIAALVTSARDRACRLDMAGVPLELWCGIPTPWLDAWRDAHARIKGVAALNDGQPLSRMFPLPTD